MSNLSHEPLNHHWTLDSYSFSGYSSWEFNAPPPQVTPRRKTRQFFIAGTLKKQVFPKIKSEQHVLGYFNIESLIFTSSSRPIPFGYGVSLITSVLTQPLCFTKKPVVFFLLCKSQGLDRWQERKSKCTMLEKPKNCWPRACFSGWLVGNDGPSTCTLVYWGWNFPHSLRVGPASFRLTVPLVLVQSNFQSTERACWRIGLGWLGDKATDFFSGEMWACYIYSWQFAPGNRPGHIVFQHPFSCMIYCEVTRGHWKITTLNWN